MGGRPLLVLALALGAVPGALAQQPDPTLGRDLAAACASCHGTHGAKAGILTLAGRDRSAITQPMRDFKTGKRAATVMNQIARGYADDQIEAIGAYFSAQGAKQP